MFRGRHLLVLTTIAAGCVRLPAPQVRWFAALRLEKAVAVSGPGDFQPSGLVLRDGRLFTVSDKDSEAILEIDLSTAEARPAIPIGLPGGGREALDLEGIALAASGEFLLVSEARSRVLAVRPDGEARWLDIDFARAARGAGLLATAGAGFEGIAVLGDRLVLAAEREPRGLVVASASGRSQPMAWQMDRTVVPLPPNRRSDFADLAVHRGRLFALVRNGDAVVELLPAGDHFEEGRWWSFAAAVAAYPYQDQRFGMAEGLAIDDQHLYVILDNNGSPRRGAPGDRRAMLFVLSWPVERGSDQPSGRRPHP